jgi:hypothetical protein
MRIAGAGFDNVFLCQVLGPLLCVLNIHLLGRRSFGGMDANLFMVIKSLS